MWHILTQTHVQSSFALHWDGNISTVSHPHAFRHICLWHLSVYPVWQTFLTVSLSLCVCTETCLFFSISRVSFLDVFSCLFAPTDLFPPFGNIQAQRPETTQSPPRLWWRSEDKTACFRKPQWGKFSAHNIHLAFMIQAVWQKQFNPHWNCLTNHTAFLSSPQTSCRFILNASSTLALNLGNCPGVGCGFSAKGKEICSSSAP